MTFRYYLSSYAMYSLHRSPTEGRPFITEQMKLCTWALAKVAEYPTLQHSDTVCDHLR